ncbi:hypothetical protein WJX84_005602 [Apatococcus fuscideae]|uniref:DNA-(apurinic or apyrimidinic site) endonuclease 2 n=1 Tax=Apatococcus fuscideae TaxID=2026836 RepID=A0AAW1TET7_9CHLO
MRLVTWNINGLRAIIRRQFGSLTALLDSLEADIICFQETKLTKADFDRDLALIDGWHSFFSFYRHKSRGYSGVATFCRAGVAVPLAAQEGFTGVLPQPAGAAPLATQSSPGDLAVCYGDLYTSFSKEELEVIDGEGRCLLTDHGDFVLGNIYAPAMTSEENAEDRFQYRMQFYKALVMRLEGLRAAGRRVVLVGDYNITYDPKDHCEPGPHFLDNRPDRQMLMGLLPPRGPFLDTFRVFQPHRTEAFTCWSTASGARVNNYGSRIDLILVAEPCQPSTVKAEQSSEADARELYPASPDNSQGTAGVAPSTGIKPEAETSAFDRARCYFTGADVWPHVQGSDHAPAVADFAGPLPQPGQPPALASCYTFTGKQGSLKTWLAGARMHAIPAAGPSLQGYSPAISGQPIVPADQSLPAHDPCQDGQPASSNSSRPNARQGAAGSPPGQAGPAESRPASQATGQQARQGLPGTVMAALGRGSKRKAGPVQGSLRAFMAKPAATPQASPSRSQSSGAATAGAAATCATVSEGEGAVTISQETPKPKDTSIDSAAHGDVVTALGSESGLEPGLGCHPSQAVIQLPASEQTLPSQEVSEASQASNASTSAAATAWRQIQQRMRPPKCKGHGEDCVIRQVKKGGANQGRLFYVCNRPDGKPPQGRCDHFEWSGKREVRGQVSGPVPEKKKPRRTEHV